VHRGLETEHFLTGAEKTSDLGTLVDEETP